MLIVAQVEMRDAQARFYTKSKRRKLEVNFDSLKSAHRNYCHASRKKTAAPQEIFREFDSKGKVKTLSDEVVTPIYPPPRKRKHAKRVRVESGRRGAS